MANKNEGLGKTIIVVLALCLVCSIVVSGAAIGLKPMQEKNAALDMQKNVLDAVGLLKADTNVTEAYGQRIDTMVVSLKDLTVKDDIDTVSFSNRKAAGDPETSTKLEKKNDPAGLGTREDLTQIYLVKDESDETTGLVLHIRGQGLWGTMYGLLALEQDFDTVKGVTFYEHKETPGLGGEITNPNWVKTWQGKEVYGEDGNVQFEVVKGGASSKHEVDALSGATLTSNGVEYLVQFWMGENGYGPLLKKLREGELNNG
ncbi:Na(+)-translocating NADH-quinone reductase subunit C [Idiomarina aminovorans]|uniref:Na(+)-translocating NADH-quinone reductase subunit C n=1 Tax=Idiomarina aminovorans TaxID=2914829 RepID=UPI0020031442|nr:Na(+)-translocating NADH-quinone reductase subunit C [Idiomarina sp. ATCH4]MCK7458135.1 Na(+)-translocating NADH-quinone reductase subunit C [Idiomarina sp. ATCH4]